MRELRSRSPHLPLLLMSGYPKSDLLTHLEDLELAGYLQKPFRLPALIELLQQVLAVLTPRIGRPALARGRLTLVNYQGKRPAVFRCPALARWSDFA